MSILYKVRYFFNWLFRPYYIAGENAERRFEELCGSKGYILEKISQDKRKFAQYAANTQNSVKRRDYLVRNLKNAEVEVKCFSKRAYGSATCYVIKYSHIKRHEEMQRLTGEPIIFAIFERRGRTGVGSSLRMIPLSELTPPSRRHRAVFYDKRIKCLCVPLDIMYSDFAYLERYKSRLNRTESAK